MPLAGLRLSHAMLSASVTMSAVIQDLTDQPMIYRLKKSMTTAKYSQPSSVGM